MDKFIVKTTRKREHSVEQQPSTSKKDTRLKNKSTKLVAPATKPAESCKATQEEAQQTPSEISTKEVISSLKKTQKRQFMPRWQIGRPWLKFENGKMWCNLCRKYEDKLSALGRAKSNMLDGSDVFKLETITIHEFCKMHKDAILIDNNTKISPEDAPAQKMQLNMKQKIVKRMEYLFRNVHALIKNNKNFTDFVWLCQLDAVKGTDIGNRYQNDKKAKEFMTFIAKHERNKLARVLKESAFISITCDGSTDSGIMEQEIVFARTSNKGRVESYFIGIDSPERADADGITDAILQSFLSVDAELDTNFLATTLVGFGCDGAAVMLGKRRGVATQLGEIQPCLLTVHCYAHRLELAYKDAVKDSAIFKKAITLLMGVYYFYRNSYKQRQNLHRSFVAIAQQPVVPTRVGGTRWLAHVILAIETFLRAYPAIANHLADVTVQDKGPAGTKARGFIQIMHRSDVIAFMHLLLDVMLPMRRLSLALQLKETTLAEVHTNLEGARFTLDKYLHSDGPQLKDFLEVSSQFKSETLSKPVKTFEKEREHIVKSMLGAIDKRYSNLSQDVIKATQIASFRTWPVFRDENREKIHDYGTADVSVLAKHFEKVLCPTENHAFLSVLETEWDLLKGNLYARFKADVQSLKWKDIYDDYTPDCPHILKLIDLVLCLPASSAENERGFSLMKRVKTDFRTSLKTETLNDLMTVQLATAGIDEYDPNGAVSLWLQHTQRRPNAESDEGPDPCDEDLGEPFFDSDEEFDNVLNEKEVELNLRDYEDNADSDI